MKLATYKLMKNAKTKNRVEIKGELLDKMHLRLLQGLKDFSDVCRKYDLFYSLSGGTALGAVRHGGFIPWDDDVDVFMTRKSYEKFLDVFQETLSNKYFLHSPKITPELGMPIVQLMIKGTSIVTNDNPPDAKSGISIDIFILENAPDNCFLRWIHGIVSLLGGFILSCGRFYKDKEFLLDICKDSDKDVIDSIRFKAFLGRIFSIVSLSDWSRMLDWWHGICNNTFSRYVVCPTGMKHYFGEIFPREKYCKTRTIFFEGVQLEILEDAEWALNKLYGDYMRIPNPDEIERHFVVEIKL